MNHYIIQVSNIDSKQDLKKATSRNIIIKAEKKATFLIFFKSFF